MRRYLREVGKSLWLGVAAPPRAGLTVAIVALVLLIAKIAWFNSIPEWFNHADEYGRVLQDVLIATIAAYIFFYFTVQLPAVEEKRLVGPSVAMLIDATAQTAMRFLFQIRDELHSASQQPVTLENVTDLFLKVPTHGQPKTTAICAFTATGLRNLSWIEILQSQVTQCLDYIDQIGRYSRFIEPELQYRLDAIRQSQLARFLRSLPAPYTVSSIFSNDNLSATAPAYHAYYEQARELLDYGERFRRRYGIDATFQPG
jgi:hypothetical protein